jgi:hypothetical protein
MRDPTALGSVLSSLFSESVERKPPKPERRTVPGVGIASCKCDRPVGVAFCHTCGKLILPAEVGP